VDVTNSREEGVARRLSAVTAEVLTAARHRVSPSIQCSYRPRQ